MAAIETGISALLDAGVFAYVVPFLLAITITYGLLEHVKVPKDKSLRAFLSILIGLLMLPLGGVIFPFLEGLTLRLFVITATVLALLIMAESTGIKGGEGKHIWDSHPKWTGVVFIMVALVIFAASGGPELIGLGAIRLGGGMTLAFFLVIIALGVWWIAGQKSNG